MSFLRPLVLKTNHLQTNQIGESIRNEASANQSGLTKTGVHQINNSKHAWNAFSGDLFSHDWPYWEFVTAAHKQLQAAVRFIAEPLEELR